MIILIKKTNNIVYIDKENGQYFESLSMYKEPYNYKKIIIDDKYSDCQANDFNDDLTFNPVKYQTRKTIELSKQKIEEFKSKLASLDYKTIKYTQGELSIEEFEKVKEECKYYRNEINSLENMLKNS